MKVLLLGELSGLHRELAPAMRALGAEVTVGHSRGAADDFPSDIPFFRPIGSTARRSVWVRDIVSQLVNAPRLTGFDVVQVVTPKFFNWKLHGPMMRFLARHNGHLVIISTSCSSVSYRAFSKLAYRPCEQCLKHDLKTDICVYDRPDEQAAEFLAYDLASAVVVTEAEYGWVMADTPYSAKAVHIPLPIDTDRHRASPMPPSPPVRIWYGETRYGFKGSEVIWQALDQVERQFGSRVEVIKTGRMAFDAYLAFLNSIHVVVDQTSKYGFGMNALYGLAAGRVVLSGAEPESLAYMEIPEADNPVINIRPEPDLITAALGNLIERPDRMADLGRQSASYADRYHGASTVALKYLNLYRRLSLGTPLEQLR